MCDTEDSSGSLNFETRLLLESHSENALAPQTLQLSYCR